MDFYGYLFLQNYFLSLFVSFVQTALNFINGTRGSKQQAVKYQPDRYESFLSLDTLDQVLRLPKYV